MCIRDRKTDYAVDAMKRRRIDEWWRGRYFLYDLEIASAHDEGSVLSMMDYANLRYGCKVFLVDNAMTMRFRQGSDCLLYTSGIFLFFGSKIKREGNQSQSLGPLCSQLLPDRVNNPCVDALAGRLGGDLLLFRNHGSFLNIFIV